MVVFLKQMKVLIVILFHMISIVAYNIMFTFVRIQEQKYYTMCNKPFRIGNSCVCSETTFAFVCAYVFMSKGAYIKEHVSGNSH